MLNKKIINSFKQWLVGFTDGDGSFYVKKNGKGLLYLLGYHLKKDDKICIDNILKGLNLNINIEQRGNTVQLSIHKHDDIKNIIIPIFDNYPLITKKRFVFEIWKSDFEHYVNRSIDRSILLKNKYIINDAEFLKLKGVIKEFEHMSNEYILGFLEAEGSFVLNNDRYSCMYYISQSLDSMDVLLAIKDFILKNWKPHKDTPMLVKYQLENNWDSYIKITKPNKSNVVSLVILSIDFLYYVVLPVLDSITWYSKKAIDYKDWKTVIKLYIGGYHREFKEVVEFIQYTKDISNRKRINSLLVFDIKRLDKVFATRPVYDMNYPYRVNSNLFRHASINIGVLVYDLNNNFVSYYLGPESASKHFNCTLDMINKYIKSHEVFNNKYRLSGWLK